jgi:hypothetical protein
MHRAHNQKDGDVVDGQLLVARRKAAPLLETIEATLNDISIAIALSIEFHHSSAIPTRWDYWYDATLT